MTDLEQIFKGLQPMKHKQTHEEHLARRRVQGPVYRARIKNNRLIREGKPGLDTVPDLVRPNGIKLKDMTPEQNRDYHRQKYREHIARQKQAQVALDAIMTTITNKMHLNASNSGNSEIGQVGSS